MSVPVSLAQEAGPFTEDERYKLAAMAADVFRIVHDYEEGKRGEVMGKTLRRYVLEFRRSAQLAALESVAKEMCGWCAGIFQRDGDYRSHYATMPDKDGWHKSPQSATVIPCNVPRVVKDAVARLRGTGGQS